MRDVSIPSVGFAMTEALLVRWLKEPGDPVDAREPVAEIETDKAIAEIEAPTAGVLGRHRFLIGTVVPVGVALTVILEAGETDGGVETPAATRAPTPDVAAPHTEADAGRSAPIEDERPPHRRTPRERAAAARAAQTPVREPVPADQEAPAAVGSGRFRGVIADRVLESWRTIPHFAVTREVPAGALLEIRAARIRRAVHVPNVTDLLALALAHALRATGRDGPIDIGLAVATPDGIVIPVLRDVLGCSLEELSAARAAAVDRARSGRLSASDLAAPPYATLSNLGPQGVDQFTGVIATGQVSLLTVGRIARRVVVVDDDEIGIRPTFHATLNADHRALDGADAAALLAAFVGAATNVGRLDARAYG